MGRALSTYTKTLGRIRYSVDGGFRFIPYIPTQLRAHSEKLHQKMKRKKKTYERKKKRTWLERQRAYSERDRVKTSSEGYGTEMFKQLLVGNEWSKIFVHNDILHTLTGINITNFSESFDQISWACNGRFDCGITEICFNCEFPNLYLNAETSRLKNFRRFILLNRTMSKKSFSFSICSDNVHNLY